MLPGPPCRWESSCWLQQPATTSTRRSSSACRSVWRLVQLSQQCCCRCCCCCCLASACHARPTSSLPPAAPTARSSPSQHAREERLAVLLAALLRRYVEGDGAGFQARALPEHWAACAAVVPGWLAAGVLAGEGVFVCGRAHTPPCKCPCANLARLPLHQLSSGVDARRGRRAVLCFLWGRDAGSHRRRVQGASRHLPRRRARRQPGGAPVRACGCCC